MDAQVRSRHSSFSSVSNLVCDSKVFRARSSLKVSITNLICLTVHNLKGESRHIYTYPSAPTRSSSSPFQRCTSSTNRMNSNGIGDFARSPPISRLLVRAWLTSAFSEHISDVNRDRMLLPAEIPRMNDDGFGKMGWQSVGVELLCS